MSEFRDQQIADAFLRLKVAVCKFRRQARIPLKGYTIKQPYAKTIRNQMERITAIIHEEFNEIGPCLEPDPKENA